MKKCLLLLGLTISLNGSAAKLKLVCFDEHSFYPYSVVATRTYAKITKLMGYAAGSNPYYYLKRGEFYVDTVLGSSSEYAFTDFKNRIIYSCEKDVINNPYPSGSGHN
jgi:hypothetical protein